MEYIYRCRFPVWLFVFSLCGCGTGSDSADDKPAVLSFGESIGKAHFVAKELHFSMQSASDQQFNASVFEAFKGQVDKIEANAPGSNLSEQEKSDLRSAFDSLKENFEHVLSGPEDYQGHFSKVDAELVRDIEVLESLSER